MPAQARGPPLPCIEWVNRMVADMPSMAHSRRQLTHSLCPARNLQVLLRWNVQRGVGVIPKAGSAGHVRENADIFSFSLSYTQKVDKRVGEACEGNL